MIFSQSKQFVFFAVPKTGTHAIREVFRPHLGAEDWEQQLRYGQQLSPLPEIAAINHGHVAYRQLAEVISLVSEAIVVSCRMRTPESEPLAEPLP